MNTKTRGNRNNWANELFGLIITAMLITSITFVSSPVIAATPHVFQGWDGSPTGNVNDASNGEPSDGSDVRMYALNRSNEIGSFYVGTTDIVGPVGTTGLTKAFMVDTYNFPSNWINGESFLFVIDKNSLIGGYSTSSSLPMDQTMDPQTTPSCKIYKIGGTYGSGTSGTDYFEAFRTTPTTTNLEWPPIGDLRGNVYGYRIYRNSSTEPWHAIGNLTGGNTTTGYIDATCLSTKTYYYAISILYRGLPTKIESLYKSYPVASMPLLTVTPSPADGSNGIVTSRVYSLQFSRGMNTVAGNVSIVPSPVINGTWNWDATNIWYNYTGATWSELTKYYLNLTNFKDTAGKSPSGDLQFNFTTGDFTPPTSSVTGPMTAKSHTFNVTYACNDPSGVANVSLWYTTNGGLSWVFVGTASPPNGTFAYVTVPADGMYGWYTSATDNAGNSEAKPPVGPGFIEYLTLVDKTPPAIGSTTADELFINNAGTYGGTPPPVSVTTNVSDLNLAVASWGIRNENPSNGTIYFRMDITNDTMPSTQQWDGNWYFVDGVLVTGGMCPDWFVTEIFVMGELNGNSTDEKDLGYILPSHYALFDGSGNNVIYSTMGTPQFYDDNPLTPDGGDTFRAYRYDEGSGYVATAALSSYVPGFDWVNLTIAPVPDGRYTVAVTAIDWAQNTKWTNEADGNPVITVDTVAPNVTATSPVNLATGVALNQNIVITFSEAMNNSTVAYTFLPNPGGLSAVWSAGNTVLTISHTAFIEMTLYTIQVTAGKDPTGNNLIAGATPNPWTFTTGDFTAPFIVSTIPADGSTGASIVGSTYVVRFSEPMNTSVTNVLTDLPGASASWNGVWFNITYTGLAEFTQYYVDFTGQGHKDLAGNNLVGDMYKIFTTEDLTDPLVNAGSNEIKNAAFFTQSAAARAIPASASDSGSGIFNVTWSMNSGPGTITWGAQWTLNTSISASIEGTYVLNLTVTDFFGNSVFDTFTLVWDLTQPASSVASIAAYWQTAAPLTINATATDTLSGVASVDLWYRFSADNVTFGSWTNFGTDFAAPWSWPFTFPSGNGYYEFYSRARDAASNYEDAPATPDTSCAYDNTAPTSTVTTIAPYWQVIATLTITAIASDVTDGVTAVELWYRFSGDNVTFGSWTNFSTDNAAPWSWSFNFPDGNGYYQFYTRAYDDAANYEAAPAIRDALCGYDNVNSTSGANPVSPYWRTVTPLAVAAAAADTLSGVASVELWYSFSADNVTFGSWTNFGTDNAAPWSWSFTFPDGNGYYEFYTRSRDVAGNYEAAPATRDALCAYDSAAPASSADQISPYWFTVGPQTFNATASDALSGIAAVELWYRFSADNVTFGSWTNFGTDAVTPWSWSFTFPDGTGYYEFYTRSRDVAGNYELAPASADTICAFDSALPVSSATLIAPYWQTASPLIINAAASATSGVTGVELWYRFSADNASFGAWAMFGNDTLLPWSWTFAFPDGNGYYEFYTRASDTAGNYETAPAVRDTLCGFDDALPTSSADAISPYWQTTAPLTVNATAADALSGVASVEFWYSFSADNVTWGAWTMFGNDTSAPWSMNFGFPNGNGYYEFYSRAIDYAGNYEAAPAIRDALCANDTFEPLWFNDDIVPYWQTTSPLTISVTATDALSGVAYVELFYRYSADNVTWGSWASFGTDAAMPYNFTFNFPDGQGYYEFYSNSTDIAGNSGLIFVISGDILCAYDITIPTSAVNATSPYWQTSSPLAITATANDGLSGIAGIELWYRYSADNGTWGSWTNFGIDNAAPWSWSFNFPGGNGYYEFYTRARDVAGNYELAPAVRDALCAYDSAAPTSSADPIAPYWFTAGPQTFTATALETLSGIAGVELWYRHSADNSTWGAWTNFGTDNAAPWSWSFNFPDGNGYYEFYTRAQDVAGNYELAPAVRDALCAFDSALPISSATPIASYWQTVSPLPMTATASATSGVTGVELWYRFSANNATWGAWTMFNNDTAFPWSWSFAFPNGNGYYQFYTRAYDTAGNYESAPASRDTLCAFDNVNPLSSVNAVAPYWRTASPLTLTAAASDATVGVASVELWYRYSADNATWGAWANFGTDSAAPWSWSFTFPNGNGYYQFYTRARDAAGNYENAPASRDTLCAYDSVNPTSSVNPVSPYWQAATPLTISAAAADTLSGVAGVELWYRFSADNVTFGAWANFGTDNAAPWSWSFTFPDGNGHYEFYTRARDVAGNYEIAPAIRDALCAFDNVNPTSSTNAIASYWQTTAPLPVTATAADTLSGVASVELWYSFSADNVTFGSWANFGTDNAAPWSWSFTFPDGNGYYEFYSRARDATSNYENAPVLYDALCAYDNLNPTIFLTVPGNTDTGVALNQNIVITFSEPMNNLTLAFTITPNPGGILTAWSAGNTVLTITHANFNGNSNYVVQVTAGQDLAGNNLAIGSVPNPWSFTTAPVFTIDYIQIETLAVGGTVVTDHTMTIDQTYTVWAIGYSTLGGRIGPVPTSWSTTGTLDTRTATAISFTFNPASAITYGTIRATYGSLQTNTGLITVNPGATVAYTISPLASTITADQSQQFQTLGVDAMGNPTGPVAATWAAENGTISSTGLFTPWSVGTWNISSSFGGMWQNTTIRVIAGRLASISVNPQYMITGENQPVTFTMAGYDSKHNLNTTTGSTYWYLDGQFMGQTGTVSSGTPGNHTIFANHRGFIGNATLNVRAGTIIVTQGIIAIHQTVVTISADQTCTFSVTVTDVNGNILPVPTVVAWTAVNGTIVNGVFTPWSAGTWTIYANATGHNGGTATIVVTAGNVARISISSSSGGNGTRATGITAGQSLLFTVNAIDQKGNQVSVPAANLDWSASAAVGTVSNGLLTAVTYLNGAQSVNGILGVTYHSGAITLSSTENVTVNVGPLHHITVSEAAAVGLQEYHEFSAQGYDVYDNVITGLAFIWGATGNVGVIDSAGVFQGTTKGIGAVTATSGGVTGERSVFVTTPAGIFASWLWLAIILFIVVIILVILLILSRRKEFVVGREDDPEDDADHDEDDDESDEYAESEEIPDGELSEDIPEEVPEEEMPETLSEDAIPPEFNEPLEDLEAALGSMEVESERELEEEEIPSGKGPQITTSALKHEVAEQLRLDRCEKMLTAAVVLPDDKEKLKVLIAGGISAPDFTEEVKKAIERRKKKEQEKDVTADEKASILEDELVAELAELEGDLDDGAKEEDLEDQILREIEDLENL
jgi:hypothetical protein